MPKKQRECQSTQDFFVFFFAGSADFFSPLDLPVGGTEPVVSVPVVPMVAFMPDVPEVSDMLEGIGAVPVAVIPVPVVSVELVPVVPVLLDVTPVSVTAVSVFAFSSFLQAVRRTTRDNRMRRFLMGGTPLTRAGNVSAGRSRGAIV
jgi:hypothetical protein